jgi:poly-gamma-glutamate synthesis protein (capsule biosynthesis protein)
MSKQYSREYERGCHPALLVFCIALVLISALAVGWLWLRPDAAPEAGSDRPDTQLSTQPSETEPMTTETEPTVTETEPEPVHVISTATIASTGDVLMHMPVVNTGKLSDGSYDFESIFRYISSYASEADYAVANLETTLCGTDNGYKYSGYPCFNCPDEIVDSALAAGFDMYTTANNHCYDTSTVGLLRTLKVLEEKGMDSLGTMNSAEAPKYTIKDINGIKIGMICYTYGTTGESGRPMVNGIGTKADAQGLINVFDIENVAPFYTEIDGHIQSMRGEGAEAVVVFMHWGYEYQTVQSPQQTQIAQKLCDLGVDVIIGGHPHVIQPVALLTSTQDENHKTVCLYSMGNAVSNQRLGNLSSISTAHTEDGVLFSVTFSKYSDGTVVLEGTDLIPCWVNMHTGNGKKEYNILPLDSNTREQWKELYNLSDAGLKAANNSFERTMKIVGEGLTQCQEYLTQAKADREAAYLAEIQK